MLAAAEKILRPDFGALEISFPSQMVACVVNVVNIVNNVNNDNNDNNVLLKKLDH